MSTHHVVESDITDLRASDLLRFFEASSRDTKCPHCAHIGQWEFHIKIDPETGESEDDPVLIPFKIGMGGSSESWTKCAGITCPQCGHFALVSMYKIAEFKASGGNRG